MVELNNIVLFLTLCVLLLNIGWFIFLILSELHKRLLLFRLLRVKSIYDFLLQLPIHIDVISLWQSSLLITRFLYPNHLLLRLKFSLLVLKRWSLEWIFVIWTQLELWGLTLLQSIPVDIDKDAFGLAKHFQSRIHRKWLTYSDVQDCVQAIRNV